MDSQIRIFDLEAEKLLHAIDAGPGKLSSLSFMQF
jgi:hypothetical protein